MEVDSLGWLQPTDKNDLSSETGMGKGKSRITRSTSPSQVTPSSQKTTAFYDGYDYQTLGLPPEDAPTKERKLANISKHRSQYPTRTKLQAESKPALESFDLNLYEREAQLRRAQLPYIKGQDLEMSKLGDTGNPRKTRQFQNMTLRLLRLGWLIIEKAGSRIAYLPLEIPRLNSESSVL